MAFIKNKRRIPLTFLVILLFILLAGAAAGVLYHLNIKQLERIQSRHKEEMDDLKYALYLLERQALIPKVDIPCGTVLTAELFESVNMKLDIDQEALLEIADMGRINMIMLPAGIPVVKSMTDQEKYADDIREQEFNMFLIQTNQEKGDYVDVRIVFPNGENYIVLGKKQLKGLNRKENLIRLWLHESEIHQISSAIIDAYIYPGTKIYVVTYVQPQTQKEAIPFYPPNTHVTDLMARDPNILTKAKISLANDVRLLLEEHLESIEAEDKSSVSAGVSTEITRNHELIRDMEDGTMTDNSLQESEQSHSEFTEGR